MNKHKSNNIIRLNELEDKYPFLKIGMTTTNVDMKNNEDRNKICMELGFPSNSIIFNNQIHSDIINVIHEGDTNLVKDGDAIITNLFNTPILTYVADCVPIAFFDPTNKVIGVAHAGWRGTFSKITTKTLQQMKKEYNTRVEDVFVVIGAAIGNCCYNVSFDLAKQFEDKFNNIISEGFVSQERNGEVFLDLSNINIGTLLNFGVSKSNIIHLNLCTNCNTNTFYSYRGHSKTPKRSGLIIGMTK